MKKDGINPIKEYNIPRRIKAPGQIPTYTQVSGMEGGEHKCNELRKAHFCQWNQEFAWRRRMREWGDQQQTYSLAIHT